MSSILVFKKPLLIDYLSLRKLIGYIALGLPFALMIGEAVVHPGPLPASVSDYFYTSMGRVLVGALCFIGGFLITYRGYGAGDFVAMKIMAAAAIGVAWFPTIPAHPSASDNLVGIFHGVFAATMFVTMTITSLFLFTKTVSEIRVPMNPPGTYGWDHNKEHIRAQMAKRKRQRNGAYRVCGIVMAIALVLVPILTHVKAIAPAHPMFWLETVCIVAFGVSWLIKGQAVLKDHK